MTQGHHAGSDPLQAVFEYHAATGHRFEAFAEGPGFLDWANQPDPFRRYAGARLIRLETVAPTDAPRYDAIFTPGQLPPAAAVNARGIAQLFYDSLALSAWKSTGSSRWALRVNASSGNLHPTEGYLVCGPLEGLCAQPMVCHYAPLEHGLEVRAEFDPARWNRLCAGFPAGTFFLGLTSIHWREAWKYGRRAYRYCMHDAGHALGALSLAAAGLGWQTRLLDEPGTAELAALLGTAQAHAAEPEEPDLLLACMPASPPDPLPELSAELLQSFAALDWQGDPNRLSPAHVAWGIEAFAERVRKPHAACVYEAFTVAPRSWRPPPRPVSLRRLVRRRRSAVAMDGETRLSCEAFYRLLDRTLAVPGVPPFSALPWKSHLHLALLVHRVDDLPRGLYLLVRDPGQSAALEQALTRAHEWRRPPGCPETLPLYCLVEADARDTARQISCQQDIASDGCFSLAMLAEFTPPLQRYGSWFYPRLYWEAGMLGQLLYLEAEAAGVRSTGIGCFFDDPMHAVLGLPDRRFQDLYHFTVGGAVDDPRLTTLPAYPHAE
ncbi:MAG: SagB/ThcOx family dehydrogenase [Gammaproteobacteria bacterium]|jgi:SagB-type dehydrogenase family enzyme